MTLQRITFITLIMIAMGGIILTAHATDNDNPKPALTVTTAKPEMARLTRSLNANGDIAAWQDAIIGNETDGLRLSEVKVNVGDQVKRGQVLATFAAETLAAELVQLQASVDEAKAVYVEAINNAQRARGAKVKGAWSVQEINRYLTEEKTAKARLEVRQAAVKTQQLRVKQTQILASDNGVISSRSATVGVVLPKGQELFRLIRQNRLEWRAEVAASELALLKPGDPASITSPSGSAINGKVRMIAPTVDPQTRLGLVYVDLPSHPELKAGMFAKGQFDLGSSNALTVPQQAVVMRDGFSYVFKLGAGNRVSQVKVQLGRRSGERIEVREGLQADAALVTSGAGFLNDGDWVKVVALPVAAQERTTQPKP